MHINSFLSTVNVMGQTHFYVVIGFVLISSVLSVSSVESQQSATSSLAGQTANSDVKSDGGRLTADELFADDHLVDIRIELADSDWDALRSQTRSLTESLSRTLPESPFTYFRGNVTVDGIEINDVGIRKKGFLGSLSHDRPSLKIKFSQYIEQTPIVGLDRLTLNNNKQDPSRMSQYLSYKVFNESGTIAPRCNFAKVTVNGEELGVYSNVESFKRPFLERFGDGSGALYEGTVTDFFPDLIHKFEHKNKRCQASDIEPLAKLLHQKPLDVDAIEEYLDVDAFMRYWATESLIGFWDGYTNDQNNFFIYRNPVNERLYFIPWGADSSFVQTMPLPPYIIPNKSVHSQSVLANRLYANPKTRERYHAAMRSLLEDYWDEEALLDDVDRVQKLVAQDVLPENRKFNSSVRAVRYFIESRRQVIEEEMKTWPVELNTGPKKPPYFENVGKAEIQFSTNWYDKKPKSPTDVGNVSISVEIAGEPVTFKRMGAYAAPNEQEKDPDGQPPPTVLFVGKREPDDVMLMFAVGVKTERFKPTGDARIDVEGLVIEGNPAWFFAKMFMGKAEMVWLRGTANLTEASMKDRAPVEGDMELHIQKMIGGKPVD